ncbi:LysM peptidoglycan-binding domain-containing protein [Chloroflexi bacterium TSY]|nr:LysM peptidoglycan-binding domain-containing protein [Chloroflexi bacterium TSY]
MNGLSEFDILDIGRELRIPQNVPNAENSNTVLQFVELQAYTVQPGDTIVYIATKFDLNWQTLLALNELHESSVLHIGQKIRLR